jgi:hypothetical protein
MQFSFKASLTGSHLEIQVDKHVKRLDEDIAKFEEEQLSGMKLLMANPNGMTVIPPLSTPYTDEPLLTKGEIDIRLMGSMVIK